MTYRYWHVFTTPPMKEAACAMILRKRGMVVSVPVQERIVRGRAARAQGKGNGARRLILAPILPRYVFVAFPGEIWGFYDVMNCKLITGCIGFDGKPGVISDTAMQDFLRRLAEPMPMQPQFTLKRGMKVSVKRGPFAELKATIIHVNPDKAEILVDLFGRSCETLVSTDQLEEITVVPPKKKAEHGGKELKGSANHARSKSGRSAPSSGALKAS